MMENRSPKVSVIVTTYNREKYLKETIRSILAQTFTDFELIVVDNFSNYDFFSVISEFNDSRIRPFQNQNDGIIAVNRNYGISEAIGEYLAFCDDDDLWREDKLKNQVDILLSNKADLVYGDALYFDSDNQTKNVVTHRNIKNFKDLLWNNQVILSTVMVVNRCEVYFDENKSIVACEDYQLWLSLYLKGIRFLHINKVLIDYRISSTSVYLSDNRKTYLKLVLVFTDLLLQNTSIGWFSIFARNVVAMTKYAAKSIIKPNQ